MKFLAPWSDKKYWRGLIVRAIEDACFMLFLGVMIWLVCTLAGSILRALGVA
jgi:hypothetical protein